MPCSACGLSKRHLFDRAAIDGGYDAVATGHNLDDEAAVLFGNTLRWNTEYLARQRPVLPARPGFPRKVKPLVRLGEREMAAYCVIRGIDYIVEECPMAAGNKHLGYKEALNSVEARSPGAKHAFYHEFLAKAADRFSHDLDDGDDPHAARCQRCGSPSTNDVCAFCTLLERTQGAGTRDPAAVPTGPLVTTHDPERRFAPGDDVLLIDRKRRRYLVTLTQGGEFHNHTGVLAHDQLLGSPEGTTYRTTHGAWILALRPTLNDIVLKMPRGAQVIYPKDLGPMMIMADIRPGVRVLESGVGSGALSMAMLRAGADIVGYELRDDFADAGHRQRRALHPRPGRPVPGRAA